MRHVSMSGFGVGGAFPSLYFDVSSYLLAIVVYLGHLFKQSLREDEAVALPRAAQGRRIRLIRN